MPDTANSGAAQVPGTAAFSKFMHVLQLIADSDKPLSLPQVTALSGYPRSTVYRLLGALQAEGMVAQDTFGAHYAPGPRLISLAGQYLEKSDLRSVALEPLRALRDATRETVHLAIPGDQGMIYIEKLESPQTVRMASRIGTRVTWYSSSVGKAYLAALSTPECNAIVQGIKFEKFTANTVDSLAALEQQISQARRRGYALDQEENEPQIFCVGCAIAASDGAPAGCISVSIPVFRKNRKFHETYVVPLLAACQSISKNLLAQT